jgi:o-succinylbenzoate---CoA ligase
MCETSQKPRRTCPIAARAVECPELIAYIAEGERLSYQDCDQAIEACQERLHSQGIHAGDRVVISAPSSLAYCIQLWALFRMGAVACPVNPALPNLDSCCRLGSASLHPPYSTIVMTSGSSGAPRAAVHSLDNHVQAALAANKNMPLEPGDNWLLSLPLFHVAGLAILFRCALAGATAIVPEADKTLEEMLSQSGPTHVSLVPTQLHRLLESPRATETLRFMKGILLGGAPAAGDLIQRAFDAAVPLVCSYGMTETAAQLCATPPGASLDTLLTSGYPLLPDTLRIGADNVIEVGGPTLFQGYITEGNDCHLPLTEDGWFRTGDVGYLDEQGRLHVTGRADAMFISGGENIQPEEIEGALCALPGIRRAVVVPVAHEEWGMVPVAFLDMESQNTIDEANLRTELAKRLPRFKIPKHFLPWPADLDAGMKADRKALADQARCLLA